MPAASPLPLGPRLLPRLGRRVRLAATTMPTSRAWLEWFMLLVIFALVAAPLAARVGLIAGSWQPPTAAFLLHALRLLVLPALAEELIFRVLPNHHPTEAGPGKVRVVPGAASLFAFVIVHPLAGLLRTAAAATFTDPVFLMLAGLLGLFCLIAYLRSGSLWPPVLLHWLVVVGWLGMGGLQSAGSS